MPIIMKLCFILSLAYYAQIIPGIISASLSPTLTYLMNMQVNISIETCSLYKSKSQGDSCE